MNIKDTTDSLLVAIPYGRVTTWSTQDLHISSDDLSAIVSRLQDLEEDGLVDVLSVTRQRVFGASHVASVKFIRTQMVD